MRSNQRIIFCWMMSGMLFGCSSAVSSRPSSQPVSAGQETAGFEAADAVPAERKEESVYVETDASGKVKTITDTVTLSVSGEKAVKDLTKLTEIRNTGGDEEFTVSDGVICFENAGNDITYKGNAEGALPAGTDITYYLDGKQTPPDQLAGKSGHLKIRIDYRNLTGENYVPLLFISAIVLDPDVFTEAKAENGTIISMEGQEIAVGYGVPGIGGYLHLSDYELTEEAEIPEYFELEADVKEFELSFISTIVSSDPFHDPDDDLLKKGDDLTEGLQELADGSAALCDGASKLDEGSQQFQSGLRQYTESVDQFADGFSAVSAALKQLNDSGTDLRNGASALAEALSGISEKMNAFDKDNVLAALSPEERAKTEEAIEALQTDTEKVISLLSDSSADMKEIREFLDKADTYEQEVMQAAQDIQQSLQVIGGSGIEASAEEGAAARNAITEEDLAGLDETVKEKVVRLMNAESALEEDSLSVMNETAAIASRIKGLTEMDIQEVNIDLSSLAPLVSDMIGRAEYLLQTAEKLGYTSEDLSDLLTAASQLKTTAGQLAEAASAVSQGTRQYTEGVGTLYQSVSGSAGNLEAFKEAGESVRNGYDQLAEGIGALSEGISEFDRKGIHKLTDFGSNQLKPLLKEIRKLIDCGTYDTYTGTFDGTESTVRFLFETEEIKMK